MSRAFSDIAFTPSVRAVQTRMGSRAAYARLDRAPDARDALTADEEAFITARDGFYQATVSETGGLTCSSAAGRRASSRFSTRRPWAMRISAATSSTSAWAISPATTACR